MKKYLMSLAAIALVGSAFVSCSNDDMANPSQADVDQAKYEAAFLAYVGGKIAPNQDWGFSSRFSAPVFDFTRSATINGDVYDTFTFPTDAEKAAAYPTAIPDGADEIKDLVSLYPAENGDLFWIYCHNGTHNYQVTTTDAVSIGGSWNCIQNWDTPQFINVYVKVNGSVTLSRNGAENINIYVLEGNVTLDSNFGEFHGLISVAEGATLNDNRDHLAHNNGIKLFNRGTVNAGNSNNYMIGNNAYVYNEGKFAVNKTLTYDAGSSNPPCFYNMGDNVELTANEFILNSNGGFVSDGTVNITGLTKVTQQGIVWVNNGHYTTGTLNFSAKNVTFYNYCQLMVTGTCKFLDGEFNMMENSYAEMGTGLFQNFFVNMHNNSGINILNGTKWGRQAQGHFQGFKAVDDNATVYVRLGGQSYVPSHNGGAFHVQGAKLTLAYNSMKFYKDYNDINQYSEFSSISYWNETTAEELATNTDGNITWDLHNVTKIVTGEDFASTGFTTTANSCSATWRGPEIEEEEYDLRIIAEDLSASQSSDFDFNDIVIDIKFGAPAKLRLMAAGGTLPLRINENNDLEVHKLFGEWLPGYQLGMGDKTEDNPKPTLLPIINTGVGPVKDPVVLTTAQFSGTILSPEAANGLKIEVYKNGSWQELKATTGKAACKLAVKPTFIWQKEYTSIKESYPLFLEWCANDPEVVWY